MAEVRKYFYMRLNENYFDSDTQILLESMPDGYLYSNILLKLYLKSLKNNGRLMFNEKIPYSPQMIATVTRHQIGTVEKALKIFQDLSIIDVIESGAIYMLDIQNFIGKSNTEADRKRAYRSKIEAEKGQMSLKCPLEIELEIEKELEIDIEEDKEEPKEPEQPIVETKTTNYEQIKDLYNETCVSFPKVISLSDNRKKSIKARLNTYSLEQIQKAFQMAQESDFLKGKNDRNWMANFDWIMKDGNIVKILEGNYKNKQKGESQNAIGKGSNQPNGSEYDQFC